MMVGLTGNFISTITIDLDDHPLSRELEKQSAKVTLIRKRIYEFEKVSKFDSVFI